jgi:adenosylcobinamide amidohydrolase
LKVLEPPLVVEHAGAPVLLWRFDDPVWVASSAVLGGGIGARSWIINAQVSLDYSHEDPAAHVASIGDELGLTPHAGVGLLTAASVRDVVWAEDDGACCAGTVGVSTPTWAAAPDGTWSRWTPGTINLVVWVPGALSDAALINAVITATEAKTQALLERAVPGTGTASDAIVVCCPAGGTEPYGGPRSTWGARIARAVHSAVLAGVG